MKNQKLKDLYELADEADMIDHPDVMKLLKVLSMDPEPDEDLIAYLENVLTGAAHSKRMREPFPDRPEVSGAIKFGQTQYGYAGFSEEELLKHVLVLGDTGAGKTTLFKGVYDDLHRKGIPTWIIDVKGGEFRETMINTGGIILPWYKIKINPLKSPDWMGDIPYIKQFVDAFGEATGLLSASKNHLRSKLIDVKELHHDPCFLDLLRYMESNRPPRYSTEERYHTRIINRLRPLVENEERSIFTYSQGIPLDELVDRNVVFEVGDFQIDERKIVLSYLLKYLFLYRKHQEERNQLENLLMMDEARYLFSDRQDKNYDQDSYTFDEVLDRSRGFGLGLLISEHIPSKLSQAARANTGSKIMLHLSDSMDIQLIADTISLSEDQTKKAVNMDVGEGILKKRNKDPVEVNISYVKPDRKVSDSELEEKLKEQYQKLEETVEPRYKTEEFKKAVKSNKDKKEEKKGKKDDKSEMQLSDEAESLLKDINFNPLSNLTDRYDRLELSRNKGTKAVKELEDGGYVESVQISVGRGGRPKFFDLTDKGRNYLHEVGVEPTPTRGRGNIRHTFWQKRSQEFLREHGYSTFLEHRNTDVFGERDGHKVGIEIVTRKDYDLSHVSGYIQDLKTDKFIVAADKKILHILKDQAEKMDQNIRDKIRFCKLQTITSSKADSLLNSSSS